MKWLNKVDTRLIIQSQANDEVDDNIDGTRHVVRQYELVERAGC
jgi:hypothetical protein